MTWGWMDCTTGKTLEPWTIKLGETGKELSQIEIANRIQKFLEEKRPVILRSAPGTGKTLPAIEAMVRVVRDDLMNGRSILYLTPTKVLQRNLVRRLGTEVCYFIDGDQRLNVYDIVGRREFTCPWLRAHMYLSATAADCARSSCPLYLPITTKDHEMEGVRVVAKWGQRRLYGLESLTMASGSPSILDTLRKTVVMINGAHLCPYFAQYAAFDEGLGPRIIVTNYFKFIADVSTGKYDLDNLAGVVIDEAELFFDLFRPKNVNYSDLLYIRGQIDERLKAVKRGEIEVNRGSEVRKVLTVALEVVDEIIRRIRERLEDSGHNGFMRLERYDIGLFLELIREAAELEDILPDLAELIQATIPLDPKQRHADIDLFLTTKNEKSFNFIFIPRRLRLLEELMRKPLVLLMGTPDHVTTKILNVNFNKFAIIEGQDMPPGRFVIVPLDGVQSLRGIDSSHGKWKEVASQYVCGKALEFMDRLRRLLGNAVVLGFAIARKYVDRCEKEASINAYFDFGRVPIDEVMTALENDKIVISTRLWRGINPGAKRVIVFIPKFPRPKLDPALSITFREMRARGIQFSGYILTKVSRVGSIDSEHDLANEFGFRNLYQAITRGNRGPDYVSFLVSIDVEAYAAAAKLVKGGLLPWPYVLIADKISEPRVIKASEPEVDKLALSFNAQNAIMNQAYRDAVSVWKKKAEDEGIPLREF